MKGFGYYNLFLIYFPKPEIEKEFPLCLSISA